MNDVSVESLIDLSKRYQDSHLNSQAQTLSTLILQNCPLNHEEKRSVESLLQESSGSTSHLSTRDKIRNAASQFLDQALDAEAILNFTLAGMAFRWTKLRALNTFAKANPINVGGMFYLNRGSAALWAALGIAFTAEISTFTLMSLQSELKAGQQLTWQHTQDLFALNTITLLALKGSYSSAKRIYSPIGPSKLGQNLFANTSAVTGLTLGHHLAAQADLMPHMSMSENIFQSIATQGHLFVGGSLAKIAMGPRYAQKMMQQELATQRQSSWIIQGPNGFGQNFSPNLALAFGSNQGPKSNKDVAAPQNLLSSDVQGKEGRSENRYEAALVNYAAFDKQYSINVTRHVNGEFIISYPPSWQSCYYHLLDLIIKSRFIQPKENRRTYSKNLKNVFSIEGKTAGFEKSGSYRFEDPLKVMEYMDDGHHKSKTDLDFYEKGKVFQLKQTSGPDLEVEMREVTEWTHGAHALFSGAVVPLLNFQTWHSAHYKLIVLIEKQSQRILGHADIWIKPKWRKPNQVNVLGIYPNRGLDEIVEIAELEKQVLQVFSEYADEISHDLLYFVATENLTLKFLPEYTQAIDRNRSFLSNIEKLFGRGPITEDSHRIPYYFPMRTLVQDLFGKIKADTEMLVSQRGLLIERGVRGGLAIAASVKKEGALNIVEEIPEVDRIAISEEQKLTPAQETQSRWARFKRWLSQK